MLYEVTALGRSRYMTTYTSRHTMYTEEHARRMVKVHEDNRDHRGEQIEDIRITPLDVDPEQLVLVVPPGEKVTRCPSYYAADHETLELEPGQYPIKPAPVGRGTATWADPYYLVASVPARRISGRLYSGFGGVNYSSQELPCEPVTYCWQTYAYHLGECLESGRVAVRKPDVA